MIKTENPYLLGLCIALFVATMPHAVVAPGTINGTPIICRPSSVKPNMALAKAFAKDYAHKQVLKMGWSKHEWKSLFKLWMNESKFDPTADNKSSTAYGIAQMLNTKPNATIMEQVDAGLAYIKYRYKTPTRALWHHYRMGWY